MNRTASVSKSINLKVLRTLIANLGYQGMRQILSPDFQHRLDILKEIIVAPQIDPIVAGRLESWGVKSIDDFMACLKTIETKLRGRLSSYEKLLKLVTASHNDAGMEVLHIAHAGIIVWMIYINSNDTLMYESILIDSAIEIVDFESVIEEELR